MNKIMQKKYIKKIMSVLSLGLNINVYMIMGFGRLNKDFLRTVVTAHKYIYIYR